MKYKYLLTTDKSTLCRYKSDTDLGEYYSGPNGWHQSICEPPMSQTTEQIGWKELSEARAKVLFPRAFPTVVRKPKVNVKPKHKKIYLIIEGPNSDNEGDIFCAAISHGLAEQIIDEEVNNGSLAAGAFIVETNLFHKL